MEFGGKRVLVGPMTNHSTGKAEWHWRPRLHYAVSRHCNSVVRHNLEGWHQGGGPVGGSRLRISEYGQHVHAHHWHFASTDNDVGHIGGPQIKQFQFDWLSGPYRTVNGADVGL